MPRRELAEGLGRGEVHVWTFDEAEHVDGSVVDAWLGLLPPEELERYHRFLATAVRHRFLRARALVRTSLSEYCGVPPADWRFLADHRGRPQIDSPSPFSEFHFNLSHTEGLVVCVVAGQSKVGVDVEWLKRRGRLLDLAERFFESEASAEIRSAPPERRRSLFLAHWTLKEAYLKATGLGLSGGMARPRFSLRDSTIEFAADSCFEEDPGAWSFVLAGPTPEHLLALAIRGAEPGTPVVRYRSAVPLAREAVEREMDEVARTR